MPEPMISISDLSTLEDEGYDVEFEDDKPDLCDVVAELHALVEKRPDYDVILNALSALTKAVERIRVDIPSPDYAPIVNAIRLIKLKAEPQITVVRQNTPYRFEIERDERQLLKSIVATPIKDDTQNGADEYDRYTRGAK